MYQRFSTSRDSKAERAVTEVLGAILVFGLVLAVLALVQVSGIPAANEQVEFEHSQRVAGDFQALDASIDAAGTRGSLGSTGVEAGVRYPSRLLFINPGPAGGSLLSDSLPVDLNGFQGTEFDESDDYLISDTDFTTTSLRYQAGYNEYANAPTLYYENGVVFERYVNEDGTVEDIVVDAGNLVNGNRISIITTAGDFSTQVPGEVSVNVVPLSTGSRAVTVAGTAPEVVLQTRLSEEEWVSILRDQFDGDSVSGVPANCDDVIFTGPPLDNDGKHVVDCDYAAPATGSEFGELTLTFEEGSYDLRMAKVGLTTNDNDDPTADFAPTDARYLVTLEGDESTITDEQTQRLTVEVRDDFNNPVSGVEVPFRTLTGGGQFQTTDSDGTPGRTTDGMMTATTDVNGRASVVFMPEGPGNPDILADLNDDGEGAPNDPEEVTFDVSVSDADGGGGGGGGGTGEGPETINREDRGIIYTYAEVDAGKAPNKIGTNSWAVDFKSTDGQTYTLKEARISFVAVESAVTEATSVTWNNNPVGSDENIVNPDGPLRVSGDFVSFDSGVEVGTTEERFIFEFDDDFKTGTSRQEFFVLSVLVENSDTDEESYQTFFIGQTPGAS